MRIELQVENADEGDDVRRATVDSTVDPSAVLLTLPQELVRELGLVERPDGSVPQWPWPGTVAGPVRVRIAGRQTVMNCVVGPPRSTPLVGSTVLAALDLVADQATGRIRAGREP